MFVQLTSEDTETKPCHICFFTMSGLQACCYFRQKQNGVYTLISQEYLTG